ncbi:MAG: hypothetical protein KYX62_14230 [Pseudomonadota bacterium]|nr:hypothetical protein [Pseudomonadota bacterium]
MAKIHAPAFSASVNIGQSAAGKMKSGELPVMLAAIFPPNLTLSGVLIAEDMPWIIPFSNTAMLVWLT